MRTSFLLLAGVAAAVISVAPASATMRIAGDPGGLIIAYAKRFAEVRASGEPVIIDGACLSACTLAIGILPRGQVCATRHAVLGFHAAWRPTMKGGTVTSSFATQAMYEIYPANVREWIGRRGGLSRRMIFLRGRELTTMVPACAASAEADVSSPLRDQHNPRVIRHGLFPRADLAAQPQRRRMDFE
jgi:hypothetical protein